MDSKKILSVENLKNGFSFNDTTNELSLKVNNSEKTISVDSNGIKTDTDLIFDTNDSVIKITGINNQVVTEAYLGDLHNYSNGTGINIDNTNNTISINESIVATNEKLTDTISDLKLDEIELTGSTVLSSIKQENGVIAVSDRILTKSDIGLSNVNNTADSDKPVSTAQAAAIKVVDDKVTLLNADNQTVGSVAYSVKQLADGQVATNTAEIAKKVDKVEGKQLSTEDYTSNEKSNLSKIVSKVPEAAYDEGNELSDKNFVNSSIQTQTAYFDGSWDTYAAIPENESGFTAKNLPVPGPNNYLVVVKDEKHNDETWRYKYTGLVDVTYSKSLWINEYKINDKALTSDQLAALNSGITSGSVAQIATNTTEIAKKVDKVEGKQLSTNDYSNDDKTKLTGISNGAQVNTIEGVQVNGTDLTITDKKVNVIVPTGSLASKDKIGTSDFDSDLTTKFDEKEDKLNLKALAYKDSLTTSDIPNLTLSKITDAGTLASKNSLEISDIPNITLSKITDAGSLASKSKIGISDFDSDLSTKFNDKEDKDNLKALAYKDSIGVNDVPELPTTKITNLDTILDSKANSDDLKALAYKDSLVASDIPSLDSSKIATGTLDSERIPSLDISKINELQNSLDGKVANMDSSKVFTLASDDGIIAAVKAILMQMGIPETNITLP